MTFPERFSKLPEYAFPRLRALLDHHQPGGDVLHMSIGEPKHDPPEFVAEVLMGAMDGFRKYPPNDGTPALRAAIAGAMGRRYGVELDPETRVFPLNGTREGLFNAALAMSPERKNGDVPVVLMPNPFYQVYAVAALTAGAEPVYVNATAENGFMPEFDQVDPAILKRTTLAYICSPSNPQGAVASAAYWHRLLTLAEQYDFKVLADECYADLYRHTPPPGALEAEADPERVVAFHSLSKRSNLPGLRSGAAIGGPKTIAEMKKLRAYGGAPLPLPIQEVSAACWDDDHHVAANRAQYRAKYDVADQVFANVLDYGPPVAGFFLWLPVENDEDAALQIWCRTGVRVLPGSYLSRSVDGEDPGSRYIRVALVAPIDDMTRGLEAIRATL